MDAVKKPVMIAISGVKNSGKTTFLTHLIKEIKSRGYQVAVIKHDGHEFEPDVEGTDTWKLRHAGAYGTAIFSKGQWMINKEEPDMDEKKLARLFPEADIIFLEGFKYSQYAKFEILRKDNSKEPVCDPETLIALITDGDVCIDKVEKLALFEWNRAADLIERQFLGK